ncbi:histidine-phosphotransfer domain, HPT domain-containing protein [Parathielavia hyrcaniae]|uniref:Histidine-phosphotransfer domain, HPT domain-containing protein n=1 Tax=Parathielavia hyrcaniae TaxID=113614 RepID=A0AAN6Q312_9PEZI|nr:histidine-phosphotransfer domain, HPT domain-containing protein [Parathielavia hyrcaniae]
MPDFGDDVDNAIFSQILEMDENEDERDFSRPLVLGFFDQASETFEQMQQALDDKNLDELSTLGHFLKGSSATLGFNKIRDSCQIIQQYGHRMNVDSTAEPDEEVCLKKITDALTAVKADTTELEKVMRKFFGPAPDEDEAEE